MSTITLRNYHLTLMLIQCLVLTCCFGGVLFIFGKSTTISFEFLFIYLLSIVNQTRTYFMQVLEFYNKNARVSYTVDENKVTIASGFVCSFLADAMNQTIFVPTQNHQSACSIYSQDEKEKILGGAIRLDNGVIYAVIVSNNCSDMYGVLYDYIKREHSAFYWLFVCHNIEYGWMTSYGEFRVWEHYH